MNLKQEITVKNIDTSWDMSQERAFIENLLSQRFNFFLVFFSLVVAGSINAPSQLFFQTILILGTFICWFLALTLFRSQKKLDIIINLIFEEQSLHPAKRTDDKCHNKGSKRKIIGYAIPSICCSFLTIISILAIMNILSFVSKS
jgi:hypothetical protein